MDLQLSSLLEFAHQHRQCGPSAAGRATGLEYLQQIMRAVKALEPADISSRDFQAIRRVADILTRLKPGSSALPRLKEAAQALQSIRTALAYRAAETPAPQRPAYSLNEEDEGA